MYPPDEAPGRQVVLYQSQAGGSQIAHPDPQVVDVAASAGVVVVDSFDAVAIGIEQKRECDPLPTVPTRRLGPRVLRTSQEQDWTQYQAARHVSDHDWRPVRDLPARLALPYSCVLPAGTPTPPGGYEDPVPTAGPY